LTLFLVYYPDHRNFLSFSVVHLQFVECVSIKLNEKLLRQMKIFSEQTKAEKTINWRSELRSPAAKSI